MKTIIPWLLAIFAGAAAAMFYSGNQTKSAEITKLQSQVQEIELLRTEIAQLKQSQVPPEELARLREARDELLRLRNQVRQLNTDKSQLTQQAQAAARQAEQAHQQATALAESQKEALAKVEAQAANTCINQLRQMAAAKQQWALDNQKTQNALPTGNDLLPYLPGQALPICPNSGSYVLGALGAAPTCSIAGHILPAQP